MWFISRAKTSHISFIHYQFCILYVLQRRLLHKTQVNSLRKKKRNAGRWTTQSSGKGMNVQQYLGENDLLAMSLKTGQGRTCDINNEPHIFTTLKTTWYSSNTDWFTFSLNNVCITSLVFESHQAIYSND